MNKPAKVTIEVDRESWTTIVLDGKGVVLAKMTMRRTGRGIYKGDLKGGFESAFPGAECEFTEALCDFSASSLCHILDHIDEYVP